MSNWQNVQLNPKQTGLAVVFILLIIGLLILRLYFYDQAYSIQPPDYIVANDELAVVSFDGNLYVLDHLGNTLYAHPLTKAGIPDDIADMQLLDSETILLADWENYQIKKCLLQTLTCESITPSLRNRLGRFFKFYYRAEHNDILFADTNRHRILKYDIPSSSFSTLSEKKQFLYPNHLKMEPDGLLYVTDTNHHNIGRFKVLDDKVINAADPIHVPDSLSKNRYPIFYFRFKNNDIYVLQANRALSNPDLILFGHDGSSRRIDVEPDADMTVMASMGNRLLVSDREQYKIHSIDTTTHEVSLFGDKRFIGELKASKDKSRLMMRLGDIMLYLMIATVICVIVFIVILASQAKHVSQHSVLEAKTSTAGKLPAIPPGRVLWLDKNPKFRFLFLGLMVILPLMAGILYYTFDLLGIQLGENEAIYNKLLLSVSMIALISLYSVFMAYINLSDRIGTDGKSILFKRFGRIIQVDPASLFYSEQYMQFGNRLFTYRNNMKACFHDPTQFEAYIQPLLTDNSQRVSNLKIFKNVLRRPDILTVINILILSALTVSFVVIFWEDVFPGL